MQIKFIIKLDEVDSTNNYARGLIMNKAAEEGTVVLTQHQNQGRGYGQNSWESEAGKNLTFSIILKPFFLIPAKQFFLSMVVSLGIFDFISNETSKVKIKWPNDIFIGEKKAGGILIENSILGNKISNSIVGIGLNMNQEKYQDYNPEAISLKQVTGRNFDLNDSLQKMYFLIFEWYERLKAQEYAVISNAYTENLFWINEWKEFIAGGDRFYGRIIGIEESGLLKVETKNKGILKFSFKEIEYCFTGKAG